MRAFAVLMTKTVALFSSPDHRRMDSGNSSSRYQTKQFLIHHFRRQCRHLKQFHLRTNLTNETGENNRTLQLSSQKRIIGFQLLGSINFSITLLRKQKAIEPVAPIWSQWCFTPKRFWNGLLISRGATLKLLL